MLIMARQDANAALAATSFLYGANAPYIEALQARYAADPQAVDEGWQAFFADLKDRHDAAIAEAKGPSWRRPDWPPVVNGELISALDGNWAALASDTSEKIRAGVRARGAEISEGAVQQATRDSVRALMMIRAYRIRGHFHANLDPLSLEPPKNEA